MKFSEFKYVRPDIDKTLSEFKRLIEKFELADSAEEETEVIIRINRLRDNFSSMQTIAYINYSNDTNNKMFEDEQDYFDTNEPFYEDTLNDYFRSLLNSKFREKLTDKFGKHLFEIAEIASKCSDHRIVEEKQKENHLCSEYMKLKATAKISFDGKERNLQDLEPFMESTDRDVRIKSFKAYWKFYSDNADELNNVFDKLVKLRNEMGQKLGYNNFKELGYSRMERLDYNEDMVKNFRESIKKYIVPLSMKLREKQRKRLSLDKLMVYDLFIQFTTGNATPKGDPAWIIEKSRQMFDEFSENTSEFFNFMINNDLMDVVNRSGKDPGGFCSYIPDYKSPYIFSNMNGTHSDVRILNHEAGHAFQAFQSRNSDVIEYRSPSSDACEIHSMSMEFLTYPWMNIFFEEDTDKFKYEHLMDSVNFLPYGVLVDDFQHWIYENPDAQPAERNSKWREMEKEYMPHLNYGDIDFLEKGGRWQKQAHIYEIPFYYIDYCLAMVCAFQFWSKAIHNGTGDDYKNEVKRYIDLCNNGGSAPFLELLKSAGLESPFEEDVIKKLAGEIENYLDSIDDSKF